MNTESDKKGCLKCSGNFFLETILTETLFQRPDQCPVTIAENNFL